MSVLTMTSADVVYRNPFRMRRLREFLRIVDAVLAVKERCRILDLGGTQAYWYGLEDLWRDRNVHITVVNLGAEATADPRFTLLAGDACGLSQFPDRAFDVVHSNSVIEHVGDWSRQCLMAGEVRRLASSYFVQTPNFWFPVEPHFRTPFIHWLPRPWRAGIVMRYACGFYPKAATVDEAQRILDDARLVDARMMAALFPDAEMRRERIGPFTKSLIAVREDVRPAP
jgi:hypothetical protein